MLQLLTSDKNSIMHTISDDLRGSRTGPGSILIGCHNLCPMVQGIKYVDEQNGSNQTW